MVKASDEYGSSGSVPTVENQGVSGAGISVHATPEDFGAGIGNAIAGAGKETADIANHFMQIATEAKVNDDYANNYVPQAAQLRQKYDSLQGQDKVAGYGDYINSLKGLNEQLTNAQPGVLGQKSMSALINKHIEGETFGASRELVQSQKDFSNKSTYDMLKANNGMAAQAYDNQPLVDSVIQQNNNHILMQHIDDGHNPNDPYSADIIKQAQDANTGEMATGMIKTAINSGDSVSANALRANYANVMPGYQKTMLDNTLHAANIQQTSAQTIKAITSGAPVPPAVGAPAPQVQALVADTAKSSEVDPNHALTVLRIESADGQNLGSRGTLGQDKESAGKPLEDQAKALCDNLKAAGAQTSTALGRPAEPWEAYLTYQQGSGGGPALLKAAQENPDMKAVDVLSKFYSSPKDALSAINGNGGNVTMSAGDFVDHIKQVYTDNAKRANCNFADDTTPGNAILTPHQTPGVTVQPAVSPTQALLNFDKKAPALLSQINAIPNDEQRAGVMKAFQQERQRYTEASTAYSNVLVNQAGQMAADPKFTSMSQVPPELQSALAADHPQTLTYMETRAQYNLDHQGGASTKDMREYGNGFYNLFNSVHSSGDDKITSLTQLQKHVGPNGDLTIAGYDRLSKELQGKNTPDGESEGLMKKQFFANAKQQISGKDETLGIADPKGEENYLKFMAHALPAYDAGRGQGKSAAQLLDPDSSDYIGKSIQSFKRPLAQQLVDMENTAQASLPATPAPQHGAVAMGIHHFAQAIGAIPEDKDEYSSIEGLRQAFFSGKLTKEQAEAEAIKRGYAKPANSTPKAPLAE